MHIVLFTVIIVHVMDDGIFGALGQKHLIFSSMSVMSGPYIVRDSQFTGSNPVRHHRLPTSLLPAAYPYAGHSPAQRRTR